MVITYNALGVGPRSRITKGVVRGAWYVSRRIPRTTHHALIGGGESGYGRLSAGGRRVYFFESRGAVAQLGERLDRTQEVRGSSPLSSIEPSAVGHQPSVQAR